MNVPSFALALVLCSGRTASPATVIALDNGSSARANESLAPVEITVDSQSGKDFRDHAKLVRETVELEAKEQVGDVSTSDASSIAIRITVGTVGRYDIEVSSTYAGKPLGDATVKDKCEQCLMDELLARVQPAVAAQVEAIRKAEKAVSEDNAVDGPKPVDDGGSEVSGDDTVPTPPPRGDEPQKRPLGPMGKSGIALLSVGVVGLGVGIGLAAAGRRLDESDEREGTDFRPGGYAAIGVSAAVLITGAVLLGVDRARAKRRAPVGALVPTLGPRFAGVAVIGRF